MSSLVTTQVSSYLRFHHARVEMWSGRVAAVEIEVRSPAIRELLDESAELELLADTFEFTEGPVWDPAQSYLLFTDIPNNRICRWAPDGGFSTWREPSNYANGLTRDTDGRLIAAEHATSRITRTEPDGSVVSLASHWQGRELNTPNDVVAARSGSVYFTDPMVTRSHARFAGAVREPELDFSGAYRIPAGDGEIELVADDFQLPNGICLSPDERRLYVNDSFAKNVRAYELRPDGAVGDGRVFVDLDDDGEGSADGMKTDERGNLWTTGPGGIWVVSPAGEVLAVLRIPGHMSNLNWGPPDWSTLYVTGGPTLAGPGSLYRLRTKVRGAPAAYMPA